MRAALNQAEKWDMAARNVAEYASPWLPGGAQRHAPTVEEVSRVTREAEGSIRRHLGRPGGSGGDHRRSAGRALALRWRHYDRKTGTLTISEVVVTGKGRLTRKGTKTHAGRRLSLDDAACALLDRYRLRSEQRANEHHREPPTDLSPIPTYDGLTPMRPDTMSHHVRAVATCAGSIPTSTPSATSRRS